MDCLGEEKAGHYLLIEWIFGIMYWCMWLANEIGIFLRGIFLACITFQTKKGRYIFQGSTWAIYSLTDFPTWEMLVRRANTMKCWNLLYLHNSSQRAEFLISWAICLFLTGCYDERYWCNLKLLMSVTVKNQKFRSYLGLIPNRNSLVYLSL